MTTNTDKTEANSSMHEDDQYDVKNKIKKIRKSQLSGLVVWVILFGLFLLLKANFSLTENYSNKGDPFFGAWVMLENAVPWVIGFMATLFLLLSELTIFQLKKGSSISNQ